MQQHDDDDGGGGGGNMPMPLPRDVNPTVEPNVPTHALIADDASMLVPSESVSCNAPTFSFLCEVPFPHVISFLYHM